MFSAVSNLSPVNIHILMLASYNSLMVSGTLSCSLSSTAVEPRSTSPFSNSSKISSYLLSLLNMSFSASAMSFLNYFSSSSSTTLTPINKVRSPFKEALVRKVSILSFNFLLIYWGSSLLIISLSAPLVYSLIRPSSGSLRRIDIRFLLLVNSILLITSYLTSLTGLNSPLN